MKAIIITLILLNTIAASCFGQGTNMKEKDHISATINIVDSDAFNIKYFTPLKKRYEYEDLISKIIPDSEYAYWEYVFKTPQSPDYRGKVTVRHGDSLRYSSIAAKINADDGFFHGCLPSRCFSYIVGIRADKTIDLIDDGYKFESFIGHIDNIEEAISIVRVNDYWYDTDTIIGGAYKERERDYLLYLLEYDNIQGTHASVKAILTKEGKLNIIDKNIYKEGDFKIY